MSNLGKINSGQFLENIRMTAAEVIVENNTNRFQKLLKGIGIFRTMINAHNKKKINKMAQKGTEQLVNEAIGTLSKRSGQSSSKQKMDKYKTKLKNLQDMQKQLPSLFQQLRNEAYEKQADSVPENAQVEMKNQIKTGGLGSVHLAKVIRADGESDGEFVAKRGINPAGIAALQQEGAVGKALVEERNKTHELVSDTQGLDAVVLPHMVQNQTIMLQRKVDGMDGGDAIMGVNKSGKRVPPLPIFENGYVDNPQQAIERTTGLVVGLHALHMAKFVHHDLKLGNIMFEKVKLPEEVIEANNKAGGEAKVRQDEYRIQIIDLGATAQEGSLVKAISPNVAPEHVAVMEMIEEIQKELKNNKNNETVDMTDKKMLLQEKVDKALANANTTKYDIYALGTMLPSLFFGQGGMKFTGSCDAPQDPTFGKLEMNSLFVAQSQQKEREAMINVLDNNEDKEKMTQLNENLKSFDQQLRKMMPDLAKARREKSINEQTLKKNETTITKLNQQRDSCSENDMLKRRELTKKLNSLMQENQKCEIIINSEEKTINEADNLKNKISQIKKEITTQLAQQLPLDKRDSAKELAHKAMVQDILQQFKKMNEDMQKNTNKAYPAPVMERLAQLTADCLSLDPTKRPTTEHILLACQNMSLSNWNPVKDSEPLDYNCLPLPTNDDEKHIQSQFTWIRGNQ
ncbi:MAG: hypothetical protein LBH08_02235 [Puniceicoccales bacterium]|jgi:serine/threonine protein kinase|nr:hypothetical protein [Puniceicoccales bacterium]